MRIALISVHGLIRGDNLELGRDADTGDQTKYVVELARALAECEGIRQVDLITRLVADAAVDADYREPIEPLGPRARIVRIAAGPPGYLRKELLWDHLDAFADNLLDWFRDNGGLPDLIHSHYADGGYVGARLANLSGVPLVHTGHSLGRVKRQRLLASGLSAAEIESRYHMARRIEAEEFTLASARRVITSTHQEIESQYGLYDHYQPERMAVVPPGTDLKRFHPPDGHERDSEIARAVGRFLRKPEKPIVLALSRADARKNIATLVNAYGASSKLRRMANLVIVAGNRDDIRDLDEGAAAVLGDLLLAIDRHDLYGHIAYPKHHSAADVPELYRLAAATRGVFVNPALTEPFGLTLIEAAASGLPVVATEDGGPQDIIANCDNGLLVDPLDAEAMAHSIIAVLGDAERWDQRAASGLRGVREHYAWPAHAQKYLDIVRPVLGRDEVLSRPPLNRRRAMLYHDRADLDQNLLGDPSTIPAFAELLVAHRKCASFGIATGRRLDSALAMIKRHGIPEPDVLITSGGAEIHYAPKLTADAYWADHIDHGWTPTVVHRVLRGLPGIKPQPRGEQHRFKISYYIDPASAPSAEELTALLHQELQSVNVFISFGQFLDILPIRASKGLALRYFAARWEIPLEHMLVAGGSGADEDMMRGNTLAVVVKNRHHEELSRLVDIDRVYFAERPFAAGICEAIEHYDFFRSCTVPEEAADRAG